jgi:hypothetical protein
MTEVADDMLIGYLCSAVLLSGTLYRSLEKRETGI